MPARENDDDLAASSRKTVLLLDLSVIRVVGYAVFSLLIILSIPSINSGAFCVGTSQTIS